MGWRGTNLQVRFRKAILSILLLATSSLPVLASEPHADAGVPQPLESTSADMEVTLSIEAAPRLGQPSLVRAEVSSLVGEIRGLSGHVTTSPGILAEGTLLVPDVLGDADARRFEIPFTVRDVGDQYLLVTFEGVSVDRPVLGYAQLRMMVADDGTVATYFGNLPLERPLDARPPVNTAPPAFLSSALADPAAPQPAVVARPDREPLQDRATEGDVGIESHGTFQVYFCWNFIDKDNVARDQRWASYWVMDEDSVDDDVLASGVTGNDGCFTTGAIPMNEECCASGTQDVYVQICACHSGVHVTDDGSVYDTTWIYETSTFTVPSTWDWVNYGDRQASGAMADGFRVFQYASNAAAYAANAAGYGWGGIGDVHVRSPSDDCDACYDHYTNTLSIRSTGVHDRSPDIVGHEYGHYLMDYTYALGSFPVWFGGAHSFCQAGQDHDFVWTEDWANFYGATADKGSAGVPGAFGDDAITYYGSTPMAMETFQCSGWGANLESNVAATLWDVVDSAVDGVDGASHGISEVMDVFRNCDSQTFGQFFDEGNACSWVGRSHNKCDFVRAAWPSHIDYNDPPSASATYPTSFAWVRGSITLTATVSDACASTLSASFYVSSSSACSSTTFVGTDTSSPYQASFDTTQRSDGSTIYSCVTPSDGMEQGTRVASPGSVRVDNGLPSGSVSAPSTALASYTVSWSASDAWSGLKTVNIQERPGSGSSYTTVCSRAESGQGSDTGTCARNPPMGAWCYRIVVTDQANNQFVTPSTSEPCVTKLV